MKQYDAKNWALEPDQFADLASSLSNFFAAQPAGGPAMGGAGANDQFSPGAQSTHTAISGKYGGR